VVVLACPPTSLPHDSERDVALRLWRRPTNASSCRRLAMAIVTYRLQTSEAGSRNFNQMDAAQAGTGRAREHRRQFGAHLRELRKQRDWTQEDLAEAAGLDRSYLAGVESGSRNPSLDVIMRLAGGIGVPAAALFDWP
jgi:DNA-binding XRE family transcriptional regulator